MVLQHTLPKGCVTTNLKARIIKKHPQTKDITHQRNIKHSTLNITTMQKSTKENIQLLSAVAMLFGGFALAVAGFIVPPTGQIHESVLGIFAECLIYAGSIFGVTIYIQTKYSELRSYLDKKLKDKPKD